MYKYKICIDYPFYNCNRIFPNQQKYVKTIIDELKHDSNINKIIIFGSSLSPSCHIDSDIDVYLELKEDKKVKFPNINKAYDYWNNFTVNDSLMSEINRNGVTVYEK